MKWVRTKYENQMEILATAANLVTFSKTVKNTGLIADDNGKKYALSGSFIDVDGNIVTQTGESGSEVPSETPIGILYTSVDVTDGDEACSLIVEGYVRADRVLDGFAESMKTALKEALPEIKFI